ncbi:ComF family protein [Nonomuraea terrae]|uniref:ComF family protein n=1 Tax=Nonomuraea terrae TaxID=2530383 RepID=UPI0037B00D0C
MRTAIVAYKERGAVALAGVLAEAVVSAAVTAVGADAHAAAYVGGRFAVVPVPSGGRRVRARGHDPVGRLAVMVTRRLRRLGLEAVLWPALRQVRGVADQAGLSSAERVANLAGSLQVRHAVKVPPAPVVLLLDDIVTTGVTLAEAAGVLRATGAAVPLAVTVAATRRRSAKTLR